MIKNSKKKNDLHKKLDLEAAKLGIYFRPNVSIGVKQVILEDAIENRKDKAIQTMHEELVQLVRSL